jgi:hypothetical protein
MRRIVAILMAVGVMTACAGEAGPVGPQGPAGPPGPQGPAGSANRFTATGQVTSSGSATRALPSDIPTTSLPVLACYITNSISGSTVAWLAVTDGSSSTSPFCGIGRLSTGGLAVSILNVPAGWYYYFVVVY